MIRKSGHRFSLATNAERVCAEIMLKKKIERDDDSKKSHPALGKDATRKGNRMKKTLAVLALCTLAQSAFAIGPDCSAIESTSGRLACYDAASPPKIRKPAAVEDDASRAAYEDPFIAEDARTTAKL